MKKHYTSPEIMRGGGCYLDVICASDLTDKDIFGYKNGIENGGNKI